MALVLTSAAVIGLIAYRELTDRNYHALNVKPVREGEARQIQDDVELGILTGANVRGAASVFSDEVGGIIRSADLNDVYDVRNNALRYQSAARIKNKDLGIANFNPHNSKTIMIPSYGSGITHVTVPNPSVFPGYEKIPNAWVDRHSAEVPYCDRASNYNEPYGELISPFNLPRDTVAMDTKFGNPWGPAGVFNKNLREGGRRLEGKADFDPAVYTNRRVSFNDQPKVYTYSAKNNTLPRPLYKP